MRAGDRVVQPGKMDKRWNIIFLLKRLRSLAMYPLVVTYGTLDPKQRIAGLGRVHKAVQIVINLNTQAATVKDANFT